VFSTDCLRFNKVRKKRGRKEWEVGGKEGNDNIITELTCITINDIAQS